MSTSFSTLLTDYRLQLLELTQRVWRCAPVAFLIAVPAIVISQISFVLAFMLPLKVIILIGSNGVPRFLEFFITDDTKSQWVIYFSGLSVGFFVLYLLTHKALSLLGEVAASRIREQSGKVALFDAETDFSSEVFLRLAETWGTFVMLLGGVMLGLLLEWRMVVAVAVALVLQVAWLGWQWNRYQGPEHEETRRQLAGQRMRTVQNVAGISTLIAFATLVGLFFIDPEINFLVGVVMFILTRQVLMRAVKSVGDGFFFRKERERIDALVFPERQIREKHNAADMSFRSLLMPANRHRIFDALSQLDLNIADFGSRHWQWSDCDVNGHAVYVSPATQADEPELRLKLVSSAKDAGLAREVLFYESDSCASLGLSPKMLATGSVCGRGFLLLASEPLHPCSKEQFQALSKQLRHALWQHELDEVLAQRLARSYASLDNRLEVGRYERVRVGCSTPEEEAILDQFLGSLDAIASVIATLPRVLVNKKLVEKNVMVTESGQPMLMDWGAISYDIMGSSLTSRDITRDYHPDTVLVSLVGRDHAFGHINPHVLCMVVDLAKLDWLISREAYAAALLSITSILNGLLDPNVAVSHPPDQATGWIEQTLAE